MKIAKSSRHSKITCDFAERLVLYWFSKHGFKCALVDHVGLDIIARNPHNQEVMGISVKSRSRNTGTDGSLLNIPNDNLVKLDGACQAFNCKPYFAIVIDEADSITAFILSQAHLVSISPPGRAVISWEMRKTNIAQYEIDPEIKTFRFSTATGNWWNEPA
jgi:hypothetical protein